MAIDFPNSPSIDDTYTVGDITWQWDGNVWSVVEETTIFSYVGDTPPEDPQTGSGWFDTSTARFMIYYDNFWIEVGTSTAFPNVTSPLSYDQETNTVSADLSDYDTSTEVDGKIAAIVDSAPGALDTLNELAAALGDDENFATTITNSIAGKQDIVSGVSDTEIGYLDGVTSGIQTQLNDKASLSGASFTGNISTTGNITSSAGFFIGKPYINTGNSDQVGYIGIPANFDNTTNPLNLNLQDGGKHIFSTVTRQVNLPEGEGIGGTYVFISGAGATTTISAGSETLILAGLGTTGNRELAPHGIATAIKVAGSGTPANNIWYISGNGLT